MRDPRLNALADVVVNYCAPVKAGDLVTIVADPGAIDAVEAIFESSLAAGAHPSYHAKPESLHELLLRRGSNPQLTHVSPFEHHRLEHCDVLIVLNYSLNTHYLEGIDPARIALAQSARRELLTMSLRRLASGSVRYVCAEVPSPGAAADASMSLPEYTDWVYRAGFLHLADPVGAWRTLREQQQRAIDALAHVKSLRFVLPASPADTRAEGTDLTVSIEGGTWLNHAGANNFPDGEIETGPSGANGVVNFNIPAVFRGVEVRGVRLKFRSGRVVEASASHNEDFLIRMLDQDDGSRMIGEIALGTNYALDRVTRNAFFDEKLGGTFHLALGAGYPQSGNTNQSALHWDMVCDLRDGGEVIADGLTIQRNGRFLVDGWPSPTAPAS